MYAAGWFSQLDVDSIPGLESFRVDPVLVCTQHLSVQLTQSCGAGSFPVTWQCWYWSSHNINVMMQHWSFTWLRMYVWEGNERLHCVAMPWLHMYVFFRQLQSGDVHFWHLFMVSGMRYATSQRPYLRPSDWHVSDTDSHRSILIVSTPWRSISFPFEGWMSIKHQRKCPFPNNWTYKTLLYSTWSKYTFLYRHHHFTSIGVKIKSIGLLWDLVKRKFHHTKLERPPKRHGLLELFYQQFQNKSIMQNIVCRNNKTFSNYTMM